MTKWLPYPESKPTEQGLYVVYTRDRIRLTSSWRHLIGDWSIPMIDAFLPGPIPDYEPTPAPTTIEWERIPDGYSSGGVIVLHEGRPVSGYCDGAGRDWRMSYHGKILDPPPVWMMKEQS